MAFSLAKGGSSTSTERIGAACAQSTELVERVVAAFGTNLVETGLEFGLVDSNGAARCRELIVTLGSDVVHACVAICVLLSVADVFASRLTLAPGQRQ